MANILAVDDEQDILTLINNALKKDGHQVRVVQNPQQVDFEHLVGYDLILLDVMMPGIDGFTLCSKIRDWANCPILFLSAKTMEKDIMYGLDLGADDYITKPFGLGELRARVNAHLRRESREKHNLLFSSGFKFDLSAKEVLVGDHKIPLTKSEYRICQFLAKNRGQVFSKEQIYEAVYGYEGESDASTIAEHVKNIRAKLAAFELNAIITVWGIGYKWE